MGNSTTPKLDHEDVNLLRAIARHGFVDMDYVYKFYKTDCKQDTVMRRIKQLNKYRYIHLHKMFVPPDYSMNSKNGYVAICLDREGLAMMRFEGADVPNYMSTLVKAAPYRIYHQVQVATTCDSIERAFREREGGTFSVHKILNEREATLEEQSNQPDALILFKKKDGSPGLVAVFVELERSYAQWRRIESKIEAYKNNFDMQKYSAELKQPIIAHRLLFVSQTSGQYDTLLGKIELCESSTKIEVLVTKYIDVCAMAADRIYFQPKDKRPYALLSKLDSVDCGPTQNKENI